jgi:hypothetical protein
MAIRILKSAMILRFAEGLTLALSADSGSLLAIAGAVDYAPGRTMIGPLLSRHR